MTAIPTALERVGRDTRFPASRNIRGNAVSPRANWKGYLKIDEVTCPVALYTAASTSDRIAFHTINRSTGNRVRRIFVDSETEKPVDRDDQVKGYETGPDDYIVLTPEEVATAVPESDKTLAVSAFVPCGSIDDVYLDKPYYIAPSEPHAAESFVLIRDALTKRKVAALAQAVLFRRVRTLLIRPHGDGLIASTLNFDYEVRSADDAFEKIPAMKIKGEMLDLARHIIETKAGRFEPDTFEDRYEAALAELVKAKAEGRKPKAVKPRKSAKVVDLMDALRQSAGIKDAKAKKAKPANVRKAS